MYSSQTHHKMATTPRLMVPAVKIGAPVPKADVALTLSNEDTRSSKIGKASLQATLRQVEWYYYEVLQFIFTICIAGIRWRWEILLIPSSLKEQTDSSCESVFFLYCKSFSFLLRVIRKDGIYCIE